MAPGFSELFGSVQAKRRWASAPGRVNLIGEHTDYNDGWVLPLAIDRSVTVEFVPRRDRILNVYSSAHRELRRLDLDRPDHAGDSDAGWWTYVAAVAAALEAEGLSLSGIDARIGGDLPMACGLSSSAALELATARALCDAAGLAWRPRRMALACTAAENQGVGVACGVMDQMASALGRRGHALLLDCRTLEVEMVPMPAAASLVVLDTGVARSLADSAFNERRRACERAVTALRRRRPSIRALRDATKAQLEEVQGELEPRVLRYAQHVVAECRRPAAAATALRAGSLERVGELMNASHASLRDLYEVSCPELDAVTERARRHPACFGARLTGAGFGGCAIALVDAAHADDFVVHMNRSGELPSGRAFRVEASDGARLGKPGTRSEP